jgi:hypothetical protein
MRPTSPYRGWTNPNYAFDKRRGIVQRGLDQQVQNYHQTGTATVALPAMPGWNGKVTGEATVFVTFPYIFIEKPLFTYGWELAPNNPVTGGGFHQGSATVHNWTTTTAGYATLYTGAIIGCVNTGPTNLQVILHYRFDGLAMTTVPPPVNDTGDA